MPGLEQMNLGSGISVIENDDCQVCVIRNETGEGVMTSYEIMDGVYLMYDDFHMSSMVSEISHSADILCLDYCYEGRMEWAVSDSSFLYQKAGDLTIDNRQHIYNKFYLPLKHYHAITVAFFLPTAQQSLKNTFKNFPVDLKKLQQVFTYREFPYLIRSDVNIERIFEGIINSREQKDNTIIKLKIFELLLYLDTVDANYKTMKREYFYKSHVEKIKQIQKTMINDLEHHYTLNDLSEKFEIPLTTMTNCFKGVYGTTIYSYMKEYRMNYAAKLLLQSDISIADASLSVGYVNPSKFSSAFKQIIGKLPNEYRKTRNL